MSTQKKQRCKLSRDYQVDYKVPNIFAPLLPGKENLKHFELLEYMFLCEGQLVYYIAAAGVPNSPESGALGKCLISV